jgi:hypothetical protein
MLPSQWTWKTKATSVLCCDDLNGYTEFPFDDGTICLALLRMEAKFGPRYAALELRLHKLNIDLGASFEFTDPDSPCQPTKPH